MRAPASFPRARVASDGAGSCRVDRRSSRRARRCRGRARPGRFQGRPPIGEPGERRTRRRALATYPDRERRRRVLPPRHAAAQNNFRSEPDHAMAQARPRQPLHAAECRRLRSLPARRRSARPRLTRAVECARPAACSSSALPSAATAADTRSRCTNRVGRECP